MGGRTQESGEATPAAEPELSLQSYLEAFDADAGWEELVRWPPDAFALTNLLLDHTKAYRFAVAPPSGHDWPPHTDWNEQVEAAAAGWRDACTQGSEPPPLVGRCWQTLSARRNASVAEVRSGDWELVAPLLTLHAVADEACARVGSGAAAAPGSFERRAWSLLERQGSLSTLSPRRMRVVPKTNFCTRGVTIRSLSRYLGLCYETLPVRWRGGGRPVDGEHTIVLLPWPLQLEADAFHPAPSTRLGNMDGRQFGFFEFEPQATLDGGLVGSLLDEALRAVGRVDTVVLPESAVRADELPLLERELARRDISFLVAGVRSRLGADAQNFLHFGVRNGSGWERFEQAKHHRWRLDGGQIRQYHLSHVLDPAKIWWEGIDLGERRLHVVEVSAGITATPLVCEDLASLDEVAEMVRAMGPGLVLALLLDGPQLASRWPCRYSGVLTDDPGSAVLTLSAFGMVERCRPAGHRRSRVVAHWNSPADGAHELELAPGAAGLLLSLTVASATRWTADGRRHTGMPELQLASVRQLGRR